MTLYLSHVWILYFIGTPYTQQSYKVSESFPFKWINKKWKEGFHVTSMTTAGSRWGVVMSRNAGYSDQVSISFHLWFLVMYEFLKSTLLNLFLFDDARLWSLTFCIPVKESIVDGRMVTGLLLWLLLVIRQPSYWAYQNANYLMKLRRHCVHLLSLAPMLRYFHVFCPVNLLLLCWEVCSFIMHVGVCKPIFWLVIC